MVRFITIDIMGWNRGLFNQKFGWFHTSLYLFALYPLNLYLSGLGDLNNIIIGIVLFALLVHLVEIFLFWGKESKPALNSMMLKTDEREPFFASRFLSIKIAKFNLVFIAILLVLAGWTEYKGVATEMTLGKLLGGKDSIIKSTNIQQLNIKIRPANFLKIKRTVEKYANQAILREKEYVSAVIEQDGETIPIKIRLKGDWTDHIKIAKKWSFRITITGNHSFMGMKTFSIQHPSARQWLNEWVFIQQLKHEDILTPRYSFIPVNVNGESWGIYAIEEGQAKQLLESHNRRESVILKYNESSLWDKTYAKIYFETQTGLNPKNYYTDAIGDQVDEFTAFGLKRIQKNPELNGYFSAATQKFEAFRRGKAALKDTFDLEKLAKYSALGDLFMAYHGFRYHNRRFYYNPVTGLIEPVHFDGNPGKWRNPQGPLWGLNADREDGFMLQGDEGNRMFFKDPLFLERYLFHAARISKPEYFKEMKARISGDLRIMTQIVNTEWPDIKFNWEEIQQTSIHMRAAWLGQLKAETELLAFSEEQLFDPKTNLIQIELANLRYLPLEIMEVTYKLGKRTVPLSIVNQGKLSFNPKTGFPYVLGHTKRQTFYKLTAKIPQFVVDQTKGKIDVSKMKLSFKAIHSKKSKSRAVVRRYKYKKMGPPSVYYSLEKSLKAHPFLSQKGRVITIASGQWDVKGDVIIPEGYLVKAGAGTNLKFEKEAIFLSHSPVILNGETTNPIIFTAQGEYWSGFILLQAESKSLVRNVIFEKAKWIKRKSWSSPGGVTFYESDVDIIDSSLMHGKGEDGLNIVRSKFLIQRSHFEDFPSDAFDGDFSKGTVENSTFNNIRGDAVDFSGSEVKLEGLTFSNITDKAVSAGEASFVTADQIDIKNAKICFASKDKSKLLVTNSEVKGCQIAATAFQKKPEYGGAKVSLKSVVLKETKEIYWTEPGSEVIIDGQLQEANKDSIKKQLYK
ncbi:MAG: CotH kinase family protein [SAR324 cluster bacterium]|nr:CotH kinase family protein [SAR324 cluster bacterium]